MGKKLNLSHLSEGECEQILNVLMKDFQIRRAEKQRVNVVHTELVKEQSRISVLKSNPKFNDSSCIVCLERFGIIMRRKRKCFHCELNVCPSCCSEVTREGKKVFVCTVCSKEKAYRLLSNEWQGNRYAKASSRNFGTAKVVRSLYKRFSTSFSDTELDSGYPLSSIGSLQPPRQRPRLDQVFDLDFGAHGGDENDEPDVPTRAAKKKRRRPKVERIRRDARMLFPEEDILEEKKETTRHDKAEKEETDRAEVKNKKTTRQRAEKGAEVKKEMERHRAEKE